MTGPDKVSAADIKSRKYFSEAIDWYKEMFVYPLRYRPVTIMFGSILLVLACIAGLYIYTVFPLQEKINVIIPMRDVINFTPNVIQINKDGKTIKQIVVENISSKYVEARESFIKDRFQTNYVFILNNSSKEMFDKYYSLITASTTDNPTKLHELNQELQTEILDIQSHTNDNKVTVIFNKKTYDQFRKLLSVSKWKADIEFYLSDYDFTKARTSKIDFIVTNYATNQMADK